MKKMLNVSTENLKCPEQVGGIQKMLNLHEKCWIYPQTWICPKRLYKYYRKLENLKVGCIKKMFTVSKEQWKYPKNIGKYTGRVEYIEKDGFFKIYKK